MKTSVDCACRRSEVALLNDCVCVWTFSNLQKHRCTTVPQRHSVTQINESDNKVARNSAIA